MGKLKNRTHSPFLSFKTFSFVCAFTMKLKYRFRKINLALRIILFYIQQSKKLFNNYSHCDLIKLVFRRCCRCHFHALKAQIIFIKFSLLTRS